jgi:glycerophosphoryl diester phosphodiesterase
MTIVIGHRGASGYVPEHTLASYALAILQGADYIEPDLVATRDGVLVARHENEIGGTTDVAHHPEFAQRRRLQRIDGNDVEGWFTEDFSFAELKTLRARERIAALRPGNMRYDGQLAIPSFEEILALLAAINIARASQGLPLIGVYPETKHPSHFRHSGLALEEPLLAALSGIAQGTPVFIQSFEVSNLQKLHLSCRYPLVQLMDERGAPWDQQAHGVDYATMASGAGLRGIAQYAAAVGVPKSMALQSEFVSAAHAAGLAVHAWTIRAENAFLPVQLRQGTDPAGYGNEAAEIAEMLALGVEGFFSDQPDRTAAAIRAQRLR